MIPHLRDKPLNHEVTPEEKAYLATAIQMSKVLKMERGNHHFYPPQRLLIQNYKAASVSAKKLDFTISVPIKFVQLLHPTRTMIQAEYVNMDESGHDPFHFTVSLPDIPSSKDWYVDYASGNTTYTSQQSSVVWSGLSTKQDLTYFVFPPFINPVNTNQVGLALTDLQYLNNNMINIRIQSRDSVTLTNPILDLTLVFYTHLGYKD
jgi:hypothetical protein